MDAGCCTSSAEGRAQARQAHLISPPEQLGAKNHSGDNHPDTGGDKVQRPSTLATAWSAVKRRKGSTASAEDMIIFAGPTDSFEFMDFSALWKPIGLCSSPRRGKTTDRRAGCGKSASPVRREGRRRAVPTHIETKTLPL